VVSKLHMDIQACLLAVPMVMAGTQGTTALYRLEDSSYVSQPMFITHTC